VLIPVRPYMRYLHQHKHSVLIPGSKVRQSTRVHAKSICRCSITFKSSCKLQRKAEFRLGIRYLARQRAAARRHQQRAPTTMSFLSRSLRIARMTFLRSCPGFVIIAFAATSFRPPAICCMVACFSVGKLRKKNHDLIRWRMLPHVTVRIEMGWLEPCIKWCFAGRRESGVSDT